jgi:predicted GNAT family N-acyltransferase
MSTTLSPDLIVTVAVSEDEQAVTFAIRYTVFVEGQNVPVEIERDDYDRTAIHILARERTSGIPVGVARIVDKGNGLAKIGRVAILPEWQGRGFGNLLMRGVLEQAKASGFTEAMLDSQAYVVGFYERLGFIAEGDEFTEAGIPHRRMRKQL